MKNLAVFDFDHTVIDDNSDTAVQKLVDKSLITRELKELHKVDGWTVFMQGVFKVLKRNNVTEPSIAKLIRELPEVHGIKNLISELHDNLDYDVVIISDSNTYFINTWLDANNLSKKILRVFSNPAEFDEQGLLNIKMYHLQDTCKLSTKNMCKGMILEDFIETQAVNGIKYGKIVYVGDGQNDFCPVLRLGEADVACARENYKLSNIIKKTKEGKNVDESNGRKYLVKAQVCLWETGQQILDSLKK